MDQALEYLVTHVYSELGLISEHAESDADIIAILIGAVNMLPGTEPNRDAAAKVEDPSRWQVHYLPPAYLDRKYQYNRIPQLNDLIARVKASHDEMLSGKRKELLDIVQQCMGEIHQAGNGDAKVKTIIERSDIYYTQQKEKYSLNHFAALFQISLLHQIY